METRKKISLAVLGALWMVQFGSVAMAEEEKPTADLSVSALSKYVWRGFEYSNDSIVIQPSMTVGYKGFSANVWGNVDTDVYSADPTVSTTNAWNETDFTLAYDWTVGPVGMTAGYIYYGLDGFEDTQEIFAKASLDTILAPTVAVYRDFDHAPAWYVTFGVSHSVPLTEKIGLDLGAQVGYLSADDVDDIEEVDSSFAGTGNEYSGFHDGLLTASITIPVGEYISVTPGVNYSFPLSSKAGDLIESSSMSGKDNFVYGGVTVSMAF